MLFIPFLLLTISLSAQEAFTRPAAGMTIEFKEIYELKIVGYDGTDLKVERTGRGSDRDERARGLRKINARGLVDNTGQGVSVTADGDHLLISQVGDSDGLLTVSVPNRSVVRVVQSSNRGDDLTVANFSGELEVSMHYNDVRLVNTSGPLAVNVVYGDIEADLTATPLRNDARLHSSYGSVDVILPKAAKADLRLSTSYGDMYTDFDVVVKASTKQDGDDCGHCSHSGGLTGQINGGGPLLALTATYDDIYLRKK